MFTHWPIPVSVETIAWRQDKPVHRETLRQDVAIARYVLAKQHSARIALFDDDSYRFAVWLLACWENGQTAVLPADDLPATRQQLTIPWVSDQDWPQQHIAPLTDHPSFGQPGTEMFTSGSTGNPCPVFKTLQQLRNETDALQQVFGRSLPPDTRFVASVPHQHMFGLMFRLLWPLTHGYAFYAETATYPARLDHHETGQALVLISSPTLLKRLAQGAYSGVQPHTVFSAGGPLPQDTATACQAQLNANIIEIYGSTESGSIAHRMMPGGRWQPQPGVTLSVAPDGCLQITSPFLPDEIPLPSQDKVRLDADGWHFLGRADRIVKIEGKRISLDAIEQALLKQPEIAQAQALSLHRERDEIAVAAVLSDSGTSTLAATGKVRFDRLLRRKLRESIGSVTLPRRWRYLSALPQDNMGKVQLSALQALFNEQKLPTVQAANRHETGIELSLYLDPEITWFQGHFPELPILPGVVQIDWAVHYGQRYFVIPGQFKNLVDLRFQKLICPDSTISLFLSYDETKQQLRFTYRSDKGDHSRGRIVFDDR